MQCIDSESTFVASACECGVAVRNDSNTWHLPAKAQYFFSATNAGKKSKHGRDCRGPPQAGCASNGGESRNPGKPLAKESAARKKI